MGPADQEMTMTASTEPDEEQEEEEVEFEDLPDAAFTEPAPPCEFDDDWLRHASKQQQIAAMRGWFCARFCDPAEDTPYNTREGGYLFIHGGPFDPADELDVRFSDVVDDDVIQEVVDELHSEVGDRWAPIRGTRDDFEDEYDERWELETQSAEAPLLRLRDRLEGGRAVVALEGNPLAKELAAQLVYGAAIGALESFLWETVDYWVSTNDEVLRSVVTKIDALRVRPMTLGDLFTRQDALKAEVKGYLQHLVWHQWEKVAPLFHKGLDVKIPSLKPFNEALEKRHHIVHRSGRDLDGQPVSISVEDIETLSALVLAFCDEVTRLILARMADQELTALLGWREVKPPAEINPAK